MEKEVYDIFSKIENLEWGKTHKDYISRLKNGENTYLNFSHNGYNYMEVILKDYSKVEREIMKRMAETIKYERMSYSFSIPDTYYMYEAKCLYDLVRDKREE